MLKSAVWRKENNRVLVEVVPDLRVDQQGNYYWKGGIPINPKIPKLLVKISDKALHDSYYPTDEEFKLVSSMLDMESKKIVFEAFKYKEKHNKANLKNPEKRKLERVFGELIQNKTKRP